MNKHTPGPWILAESVENRFSKTDMRRVRAANEGAEHGAVCEVYGVRDGSTACANARLIASAPDLVIELRQAVIQMEMAAECIEKGRYDEALLHVSSLMRSKKEVLAKATGE